jgi:thymidylate synthase (FAD)
MNKLVNLVHITPEAENLIAYMARVSNPTNQSNTETSAKLIKYLITNNHWSPFEMVNMCVEINTTRSIAAQILRHRSFSFQEFSQRYAEVTIRPEIPSFRSQDLKNRQNSVDDLSEDTLDHCQAIAADVLVTSMKAYQNLLDLGVAKECARELLPMCTPTRMYMNGSIRSWLHYCDLRTGNGTQLEHKEIAQEVAGLLLHHLPNVCQAMWGEDCFLISKTPSY